MITVECRKLDFMMGGGGGKIPCTCSKASFTFILLEVSEDGKQHAARGIVSTTRKHNRSKIRQIGRQIK